MKNSLLALAFASVFAFTAFGAPGEKPVASAETQKKEVATDKPVPKSSFTIPAKPKDGHDPFFPLSDRLFAVKTTTPKPTPTSVPTDIVFNGLSGAQDRRLAMINGHTFAEGEEASVNTMGGRVRVLLVALKGDTAVVEIAGERRELTFQGR